MPDVGCKKAAEIRNQIITACKERQLIPFVGAGFSCNITPEVAYDAFIRKMIEEECKVAPDLVFESFHNDYARIVDFLIHVIGKNHFNISKSITENGRSEFHSSVFNLFKRLKLNKIKEEYEEDKILQHIYLCRSFDTIFTTNWDVTIEQAADAFSESGLSSLNCQAVWISKGEKKQWSKNKSPDYELTVVKYHGDIYDQDSLVIGEEDYYKRLMTRDPMDYYLGAKLGRKGLLFLGYNLTDVNVRFTIFQVNAARRIFNEERQSYLISIDDLNDDLQLSIEQHMLDMWNILLYFPIDWTSDTHKEYRPQMIDAMRKEYKMANNNGKSDEAKIIQKKIAEAKNLCNKAVKDAITSLMKDIYSGVRSPEGAL